MDLTGIQLAFVICAALLVGFTKSGVPTLGIFVAAMLASVFPASDSVGLLTPILITGDVIAIVYYRRTVEWKQLLRLFPWVIPGMAAGYFILEVIANHALALLIGLIVLVLIGVHAYREKLEGALNIAFSKSAAFNGILGMLAGFTTMVGNAAGSIMSIYLLSKGMNKTTFIGTNAMFFFIVNVLKVPFTAHLGLITAHSLTIDAYVVPVVALGTYIGFKIIPRIPRKQFERLILSLAALGGLYLIVASLIEMA